MCDLLRARDCPQSSTGGGGPIHSYTLDCSYISAVAQRWEQLSLGLTEEATELALMEQQELVELREKGRGSRMCKSMEI